MPRTSKSSVLSFDGFSINEDDIPDELLQLATKQRKQDILKSVESGGDPNIKEGDMQLTPIFSAIIEKDIPFIKLLVSKGAKLEVKALNQLTPLAMGVSTGDVEVVKCLLDLGADIQSRIEKDESVLHVAAAAGWASIINLLIDRGLDVNVRSNQAETALHLAVRTNKIEAIKVLVRRGADVNAKSCPIIENNGEDVEFGTNVTPVFLASVYGHVNIVKILIKAGANVNIKTSTQYTALHPAAQEGPLELVKMLIDAKINVNVKSRIGRSSLHLAAKTGQVKIVETLLNVKGIEKNAVGDQGETPLLLAAMNGHLEVVKLFIAKGISVNDETGYISPLMAAFLDNRENVAIWLIKNGANVDSQPFGLTALHNACVAGSSVALIKLLIDKGCDVNEKSLDGATPVMLAARGEPADDAARKDNVDIVRYLVSRGADPNEPNLMERTPLHYAAKNGWTKTVEYLVTVVDDLNPITHLGVTPLLMATIEGHHEIVEILLKNGADPNLKDAAGQTPMDLAASKGHGKVVDALLRHSASTKDTAGCKQTPLFSAAGANDIQMALSLLQNGANVNAKDDSNQTPLHIATGRGYQEMVDLLLKYGADPNIKHKGKGYSSLYVAVKFKFPHLVKTLLEHGADVNTANKNGVLPIHVAARTLDTDIVKLLLSYGAYYNVEARAKNCKGSPLKFARKANDTKLITIFELIKKLLSATRKNDSYQIECCIQAGAIVNARNADGKTALHFSVDNSNVEAIKLLLEYNANIALATNKGDGPLHMAVCSGNEEILSIFLKHAKELSFLERNSVINAATSEDGGTALHIAAEKNNLSFVHLLLQNGAVYNMKNKAGKIPLSLSSNEAVRKLLDSVEKLFAVVKNNDGIIEDLVQILEQGKSIVNARDSSGGGTLLYWSTAQGNVDIVNLLLKNGADCCLVTDKGTSPLHISASKGYTKIVKILTNHMMKTSPEKISVFVNMATASGTTPLHVASNKDIAYHLLQVGATFMARNRENKALLELTKNDDVKKLLTTTQQLFENVKKGRPVVMNLLDSLELEELKAVTGSRNEQGQTLLQVAQANGYVNIAAEISKKIESLN